MHTLTKPNLGKSGETFLPFAWDAGQMSKCSYTWHTAAKLSKSETASLRLSFFISTDLVNKYENFSYEEEFILNALYDIFVLNY